MRIEIYYNPFTYRSFIRYYQKNKVGRIEFKNIENKPIEDWIDFVFISLLKKFDESIDIVFYGRRLDFEELERVKNKYENVKILFEEVINVKEIQNNLYVLLKEINNSNLDTKNIDINNLINKTFLNNIEIAVLATISSGKSTFINALLGNNLLPSKNEACTSIVCKIIENNNLTNYRGRYLYETKDDNSIKLYSKFKDDIDSSFIEEAQLNPKKIIKVRDNDLKEMIEKEFYISSIEIEGSFYKNYSEFNKLILIDTPGPNNALNANHKEYTFKFINDSKLKPLIIYVMNATQFGIEDDHSLLNSISKAMNEGGQNSKDRFIFLLNKIDQFDPDKEDIEYLVDNVKKYLIRYDIVDPIIFPISSEIAKVLRMKKKDQHLTIGQKKIYSISDFFLSKKNNKYIMNMLNYSTVSKNIKNKTKERINNKAKEKDDVIIEFSGITMVEDYIINYLERYALPFKINHAIGYIKSELQNILNELELKLQKFKEKKII